jgi:acyl carrier protein
MENVMDPATEPPYYSPAVKRVMIRYMPGCAHPDDVPDDEPLAAIGIDSLRSIDLLLDLESTFGITFPDEVITADNFSTAARIATTIANVFTAVRPEES